MEGKLAGKRVLVVEDEYFIASDLKRALLREEAVVVGPTGDLGQAAALIEEQPVDAAILDVNLEGATTYALAERLSARAVPYMFLTGYDGSALPEDHRAAPRMLKPFPMHLLVDQVSRLVGNEPA